MDLEPNYLRKGLKPVTLYLVDLHWIEKKLLNNNLLGKINFDINNIEYSLQLVRMVKKHLDEKQIQELDNLEFEYGNNFIQFLPNGTYIHFNDVGEKSRLIYYEIRDYLKPKQRLFPFLNQKIYFTEKPKGNFFTQEKMPVWLILIMFILGGVFTKLGEMLIEAIQKIGK